MEPLAAGDPRTVGPYQLLGRLGAGGMGEVFLGRGPQGRTAAVKVIHAQLAADADFRRRFEREVGAAKRVSQRWTAPVWESDTTSAVPWVATGYLPGPSLHRVVDGLHGPLPDDTVWSLAHGLAQALTDIHAAGLVHRDLKPSNVLVTLEGPRVIDFGIARAADASLVTRTGSLVGSPGYMPPEQIRDEPLTGATDVFALGAVLAFASTGTAPFSAGQPPVHTVLYRVLHEEPELGPADGPLAGELRALVARCLARDPAERPSPAELVEATSARGRAAVDTDSGLWLPATLTSRLGREAAGLLALDTPAPTRIEPTPTPPPATLPNAPATPPPPGRPPVGPTTPPPDAPTMTAPPAGPPPGPGPAPAAGRRRLVLGAAVTAAVVTAAAVGWALTRSSDEDAPVAGGPQTSAPAPGDPGEDGAGGPAEPWEEPEAPLHHLLPPEIQESDEVLVHTAITYPPIMFEEDGAWTGFEPELAAAAGELLGVEFRYERRDYTWLLQDLTNLAGADLDSGIVAMAALPSDRTDPAAVNLDFVNHFQEGQVLVTREGVAGPADLCGATVASWGGDEAEELTQEQFADAGCATPVTYSGHETLEDALAEVAAGAADAAAMPYGSAAGLRPEIEEHGLTVSEPYAVEARGIAVSVGEPDLRDALQQAIQTLIDDGTYAELLERWEVPELAVDSVTVNTGE
ncbi:serine/threonine-protein kinase [Streptomyces sp. DSM 44915]|uniref:Serine/threonine-protein kinase n=1 Tax=Streptomyces chisholmiae TaxID=3075540 RepID=A0ABU2JJ94_9ACTN|nr:serine/threonine-protein kinase [Streptomyces sp. DSM 44915]MDT0265055.1 serine/threonine-protein kinase [Streptomyces sp. DSM 44915]